MNKYLNDIQESCTYVVNNSQYVTINDQAIQDLLTKYDFHNPTHWLASNPYGLLDLSIEEIVNFLIHFGAIDCCFWGSPKWTITTPNGDIDGAFALIYCFIQLTKNHSHLDFTKISFKEYQEAMHGNVQIPFLKERYQILKEVSTIINTKMQGNFYTYIKDITSASDLLNIIISNFPSFNDTRTYQGHPIYFYKLAQLVVSDIFHIRNMKENIPLECQELLGCADYKIPQVLRGLGILVYNEELSNIVDNRQEIPENSPYEIEIRANMLIALKKIQNYLPQVSLMDINDFIWSLGQDKTLKLKPYHLTRTLSY